MSDASVFASLIDVLSKNCKSPLNNQEVLRVAGQVSQLAPNEVALLFEHLIPFSQSNSDSDWPHLVAILLGGIPEDRIPEWLPVESLADVQRLYHVCPPTHVLRNWLLGLLANHDSDAGLEIWCQLICEDPPQTSDSIQLAFGPLVKHRTSHLSPTMLSELVENATDNLAVAAAVYELANHEFRSKTEDEPNEHPLVERAENLCDLLGMLIGRMSQIEEGNLPEGATAESLARTVQDSVALVVAIIDALALLRFEPAAGKFNQALQLRHRRIQVEAATGLARLGDESGKKTLISLAQHPAVRPRVIAYVRELGMEDEVSLEHTGPIAIAESELAIWLSQPEQMGFAPTSMRLLDQRELYWPSYEDPVSCFLFEFEYGGGENKYANIGISGPLTHVFSADIRELSIAQQYSAFAGWQTVSDEIYTVPFSRAENLLAGETDKLKRRLSVSKLEDSVPRVVASFFGVFQLVATGYRDGEFGTLIVEDEGSIWIDSGNPELPIDWQLAWEIWKGRKLLTNFNPAFS